LPESTATRAGEVSSLWPYTCSLSGMLGLKHKIYDTPEVAVEYGDPNEPMAEYQQTTQRLAETRRTLKTELLAALNAPGGDAA
ncbi:hypothetical protein, partial [Achromobacter dolens]|uniref:hypothetical protein n=1 Tax=Achromobacter dolens TaxID=1287738 RepID=UPI001C2EE23A